MIKKFVWEAWVDPIEAYKGDFVLEEDQPFNRKLSSTPVMHTPYGPLPITEYSGAGDRFDLWILHTNFDITPRIIKIIEKTRGVDSVDPITRYRARIGFPRVYQGKSPIFNVSQVKKYIQDNILTLFHEDQDEQIRMFNLDIVRKLRDVRDSLDSNSEYWAIYILQNGQMDVVKAREPDEHFIDRVGEFTALNHMVGGLLLTSEVD